MSITKSMDSYPAYRMPDRFAGQFALEGADISQDELMELQIFDEYLASHVQQNGICTVQCMLLWSEWVRTFRRKVHGFPKLIQEQEFHKVILDKYGVTVADEGFRGRVFAGLQFIP